MACGGLHEGASADLVVASFVTEVEVIRIPVEVPSIVPVGG